MPRGSGDHQASFRARRASGTSPPGRPPAPSRVRGRRRRPPPRCPRCSGRSPRRRGGTRHGVGGRRCEGQAPGQSAARRVSPRVRDRAPDDRTPRELADRREAALHAGSPHAVERQHAKGKMTARERIDYLLDDGVVPGARHAGPAPGPRAWAWRTSGPTPTASSPASGPSTAARCASSARTSPSSAARWARCSARRSTRSWTWPSRLGVPMIGLNDGGGARIQEGVVGLHYFGGIFYRNVARLRASSPRSA